MFAIHNNVNFLSEKVIDKLAKKPRFLASSSMTSGHNTVK